VWTCPLRNRVSDDFRMSFFTLIGVSWRWGCCHGLRKGIKEFHSCICRSQDHACALLIICLQDLVQRKETRIASFPRTLFANMERRHLESLQFATALGSSQDGSKKRAALDMVWRLNPSPFLGSITCSRRASNCVSRTGLYCIRI
jgi:hypothetical protein